MGVEEEVLKKLLDCDAFHDSDPKCAGIAQAGVDRGFSSLSPAQQHVVTPFMRQTCEGVVDPGGHHNGCTRELEGKELIEALDTRFADGLVCAHCKEEASYYEHQWERIKAE